ncbi:hypothetical protein H0H92_012633, partial [Tricholoma furcatifolium]
MSPMSTSVTPKPIPTVPAQDACALLASTLLRNAQKQVKAIKNPFDFAQAFAAVVEEAGAKESVLERASFVKATNLAFVDQFDFARLADQSNMLEALKKAKALFEPGAAQFIPPVKVWLDFVGPLYTFVEDRRAEQAARDRKAEVHFLICFFAPSNAYNLWFSSPGS